jgi:hypothetical protein
MGRLAEFVFKPPIKIMSNDWADFWADAEVISVYTDSDALMDGVLTDVSTFGVYFNGRLIMRATVGATDVLNFEHASREAIKQNLEYISANCRKDREGADAWGIFEPNAVIDCALWLVVNELGSYTLMKPSEY